MQQQTPTCDVETYYHITCPGITGNGIYLDGNGYSYGYSERSPSGSAWALRPATSQLLVLTHVSILPRIFTPLTLYVFTYVQHSPTNTWDSLIGPYSSFHRTGDSQQTCWFSTPHPLRGLLIRDFKSDLRQRLQFKLICVSPFFSCISRMSRKRRYTSSGCSNCITISLNYRKKFVYGEAVLFYNIQKPVSVVQLLWVLYYFTGLLLYNPVLSRASVVKRCTVCKTSHCL